jgi:hypothetical protein
MQNNEELVSLLETISHRYTQYVVKTADRNETLSEHSVGKQTMNCLIVLGYPLSPSINERF